MKQALRCFLLSKNPPPQKNEPVSWFLLVGVGGRFTACQTAEGGGVWLTLTEQLVLISGVVLVSFLAVELKALALAPAPPRRTWRLKASCRSEVLVPPAGPSNILLVAVATAKIARLRSSRNVSQENLRWASRDDRIPTFWLARSSDLSLCSSNQIPSGGDSPNVLLKVLSRSLQVPEP